MDRLVAGDHAARLEHLVLAVGVADIAACFAQDDDAGGEVPGLQIALPDSRRSRPAAIQARSSAAAPVRRMPAELAAITGFELLEEEFLARPAAMRNAGAR